MADKQLQKAGDDAVQVQGENVFIVGIDEKRAREIFSEMFSVAMKSYTPEAIATAKERDAEFEYRLMNKMSALDDGMKAFADPGFQLLLVEAQKRAAATERPADYDLLSELLIHRVQKGENRNTRAGINRAVEIVDQIAGDALLGLTVHHAATYFRPVSGDVFQGLDALDGLFAKIIYSQLPVGIGWIEHLDILDAVRISSLNSSFVHMKKVKEYYSESMSGYIDIGIEKASTDYNKAVEILSKVALPWQSILIDHVLNDGYARICVRDKESINDLSLPVYIRLGDKIRLPVLKPLSEEQKEAIKSIYDLYKKDSTLKNRNIERFMQEWDKRPLLKKFRDWWDNVPTVFSITSVGRVLAHANAQRCDKTLPPLN